MALGAVAVQVVRKHRGQREILAHVGSARTDAELGILLERAQQIVAGDQQVSSISRSRPGLNAVAEAVFRGLVIARVVEPTSNAMTARPNSVRVLADLGADTVS
jgi:hypothetical protein